MKTIRCPDCNGHMKAIWNLTDFACGCGRVVEHYDDMTVDGYTGQVIVLQGTHGHARPVKRQRALFSLKDKFNAYERACELGFSVVAAELGISASTLRKWKTVRALSL